MSTQPARGLPRSVSMSVNLVWALVGLAVLNTLLTIVLRQTLIDSWIDANPGWKRMADNGARSAAESAAPNFVVVPLISLVLFGLLYVGLALALRGGHGWARIVLTVLGVLSILSSSISFVQHQPAAFLLIPVLNLLLTIALLYFLWQRDTSEYVRRS